MLKLNTIHARPGATHRRKRLGRGSGSGHGPTAGKGDKGQLARSGGVVRAGFEGGQSPLYRRLPKRGFKNQCARFEAVMNLTELDLLNPAQFKDGVTVTSLKAAGLVWRGADRLVILGNGDVTKSFQIKAHRVSGSAKEKIEKAKGSVEVVAPPGAIVRNSRKNKAKSEVKTKSR